MQHAPPAHDAPRYPLVCFVMISAVLLSFWRWRGDVPPWLLDPWGDLPHAPLSLITAALFHGDLIHLVFNLSWLWVLGTRTEWAWGTGRALLIMAFLSIFATGMEQIATGPSIGLSGVGYGLWALLASAQKRVARLQGSVDRVTSQLFVIWFFVCIVLTALDEMNVANYAHGAGALGGWLLAECITARRARGWWIAGTSLATAAVVVLALR